MALQTYGCNVACGDSTMGLLHCVNSGKPVSFNAAEGVAAFHGHQVYVSVNKLSSPLLCFLNCTRDHRPYLLLPWTFFLGTVPSIIPGALGSLPSPVVPHSLGGLTLHRISIFLPCSLLICCFVHVRLPGCLLDPFLSVFRSSQLT